MSSQAPHTVSIRNVDVRFPFEPYDCQVSYMEAVIQALQTSQNALLESPTGTGKTLCLLCATLSWRESLRDEKLARIEQAVEAQRKEDAKAADRTTMARKLRADARLLQAERDAVKLPTVVYASRTHSQLHQVMGELKRTSFAKSVKTTVLSSRQQTCRHEVVKKIESGVALKMGCKSLVSKRSCKFYNNTDQYLLDHLQVGDNEEEGERKDAAMAATNSSQLLDIEDLVKIGDHKTVCPYYLSRGMVKQADVVFLPYNYLIDPKTRAGLDIDWEDAVVIFDEAHNIESVCSGSASFDLPVTVIAGAVEELGTAVELMQSGASGGGDTTAADRGHMANMRGMQLVLKKLEDVISSYDNSVTKPGEFIVELFRDLRLTDESWTAFEGVIDVADDVLTELALENPVPSRMTTSRLSMLRDCLGKVFSKTMRVDERDFSGYRVHIHKEKQDLRAGVSDRALLPTLSFWCFDPGEGMEALREGNMNIRSILLTSGTLSPMSSFALELRTDFPVRLENPHVIDNKKQVWIGVVPKGPAGATLNSSFKTRNDASYLTDLGNSIVNFARMIPDGMLVFFPSYASMSRCIDDWKSKGIWERLGQYKGLVVEPTNSAAFANADLEYKKKLDAPQYNGAAFFGVCRGKASEGLDFSDRAGRAVIICGIPFANAVDPKVKLKKEVLNSKLASEKEKGRGGTGGVGGVGGVGNPRPLRENTNANSPLDGIFNTSNVADRISGDTWYVQQAMRAVNQAIGRVIRHKDDFGAIILCEERFSQSRHIAQLSKWLREDVVTHDAHGDATKSLDEFFRSHRGTDGNLRGRIPPPPPKKRTDAFAQVGGGGSIDHPSDEQARSANPPSLPDLPIIMPKMLIPPSRSGSGCLVNLGLSSSIDSLLANGKKGHALETGASSLATKGNAAVNNYHNKPWLVHERKANQRQARSRSLGLSVTKAPRPAPQTRVGPVRPVKRHDTGNLKACLEQEMKADSAKDAKKRETGSSVNTTSAPSASTQSLVVAMKTKLGDGGFNEISAALRTYSIDKKIAPLIEEASRLLYAHDALADMFRQRIPEEHRRTYDVRIQRERRLRMAD